MKIQYKNKDLDVVKTSNKVNILRAGVRNTYKDSSNSQHYVKCFSKWWRFPQEVSY
ncbi:hypothetical protein VPBG_00115 [Vibrio phage helene 12B3]|uniref:hypothetical protein n=1 Tax=Vibrio phage helene 12B3 TaxID=573173 RepID=UPI0002C0A56F|nr:hypothetical protein VPBG_00115 [Vibrio phage helene 12B3]YP_009222985.1 hypothetical protein VPLG_00136 [Vibrio phage eugene 12A10]AGG57887.1 hypothetical protein VPBG_00115 [Vibrio phage helene 12B3]AGN51575.1 hypothetical protein VPLG_00136 [Vibrio phage eugene 12A10]